MVFSSLFTEQKVVLITGATIGIGLATAKAFHREGWRVWAGFRDKTGDEPFRWIDLDVRKEEQIETAVAALLSEEGRIDALINNAGYGLIGAEESIMIDEAKEQFEVNFFGPLRLIQAITPTMRKQKSGHIINISSTSGVRAVPGLGIYGASKFALEGLSESLAVTLTPWNIKVSLVEPGGVNNAWANRVLKGSRQTNEPLYERLIETLAQKLPEYSSYGQNCDEIAKLIVEVAQTADPDMRYQTSAKVKATLSKKLVDLTGNKMRDEQIKFMHEVIGK
jgi:NAD(P)-dependent dehydrogenase (short-subunit alcohol dehydrogenase family)